MDEIPVTSCHGIWPRKVPRGGGSCRKSPEKITLSPPKGATRRSPFFAYFVADRSMMSWRQRASRRASISALTMLISSMSNQRHFTASFAKSNMRCASMLWSFPCHANPNALWIVSPSKGSAFTAWNATTWNSTPCRQPKQFSNKSRRSKFKTY